MAIDICVLEDQGILQVTYSLGDVTEGDLISQRKVVAEAVSRSALRKVLVDASALARLPSLWTTAEHNAAVSQDKALRLAKFAVVVRSLGSDEQFLETSGRNRGVWMKCFTSRESALSWLHEETG